MKILILGLLSLAVCLNALSISVVKRDAKDDLLVQTEKLKKLATDEIAKLKAEGKVALAGGLQKAEKTVIDLENQLKGLNPQTEVGKGLLAIVETGLKKVETTMEAEIKKLSGSFFANEKKDDLLAQTGKLKKLAADEIAKLKAEGKVTLAGGLEKAEKTVIDLENQLKGLNPQTEVGKGLLAIVEAGLKKVETTMEAEIKKLSGSFFANEKKDDLLAQTGKLKKLAADEIAKLKAEGKVALAGGLEKAEKTVIDLENQLKGLNPQTEVGKGLLVIVETGLKKVETAMEAEIKKLSGSFYEGDDELAKILAKLEEEKKKLSGNDELEALKKRMEEEMKKAMGGSYYADEVKEQLIIQSEKLRKLAADEIAKLKAEGKVALAGGLQKAEKTVIDLETQLKGLNPQTEVGKGLLTIVEAGLKKVETTMEAEIKKLSGSFFADEKKDDLLAQTGKLKKLAADEIAKLKAEGKVALAGGLEKAEKTVIDLENQLKGLNPQTEVGKGLLTIVEAGLKKVETAMEAEIKKLSGSFYEGDDELEKLKAKLEEEKKKMGSTSPIIDDIRAKIEAELKKMAGGFF